MSTKRYSQRILLLFVPLIGCSNSSLPDNQAIQQRVSLETFQTCSQLERYLKDTAELEMRSILESFRSHYGAPTAQDRQGGPGSLPASMSSGPEAYTQTNNQVSGVDEADIVKNDGTRMFVLTGRTLYLLNSWPPSSLVTTSQLDLEGQPREMLFDERHRLIVFSGISTNRSGGVDFAHYGGAVLSLPFFRPEDATKISVIDVSDMSNPRLESESYLPGSYLSSRRVGASIRVVVRDDFRWPSGVRWYPDDGYPNRSDTARAWDKLIDQNARIIRNATLEEYLPHRFLKNENGQPIDIQYSCSEFSRTNAPTQLGYVTVATLNLDDSAFRLSRRSVVGQSFLIYASANNIYLTTPHWWWRPESGQKDYTYFHKFDVSQPNQIRYVASGGTEGYVVNQFSIDEQNDFLRVATTPIVWQTNGAQSMTNRLTVFKEDRGTLRVIGQTGDIAKGERIYSARFLGDKAFVVTFRQVDPLFTFDLTDAEHPRAVGELEVAGFSTYLHPLDGSHLLAIGEYRDSSSRWGSRSVQLSIFDVSDFAHPRQTFTQAVGSHNGYSEAEYNHKAFNYFPERKLLAIPMNDWNPSDGYIWGTFVSDLRVFKVDANSGFEPKGALSLADLYRERGNANWTWYWSPNVRRSVMADNFVYAISDAAVRVADVDSLGAPIQTVQFTHTAH